MPHPGPTMSISGPSSAGEEAVVVNASVVSGSPTSGLHYTWGIRTCTYQPSQPCSPNFVALTSGVDVLSQAYWMGAQDVYVDFEVEVRLSAGGPVFTSLIHHVAGPGGNQSPCYPLDCDAR
jgi:hypothetical protein